MIYKELSMNTIRKPKDDLFIDIYNHLHDKLELASSKFIHTFDRDFEVVKYDKNEACDYLELSHIDENNLSLSKCVKYKTVRDYVVLFDSTTYLQNILKSYKYNKDNIWDQFDKDLPRTDIYIDNSRIYDRDKFISCLGKLKSIEYKFDGHTLDLLTVCALLCNQSSYALPYILMTKVHAGNMQNVMISNIPEDRNIKIELNDAIKFKFDATFGIKHIASSEMKGIIKINLELNICVCKDRAGDYILKNTQSLINRYGVITWTVK